LFYIKPLVMFGTSLNNPAFIKFLLSIKKLFYLLQVAKFKLFAYHWLSPLQSKKHD
jgi:hypothetical protein